jgi:hypothetical protein
MSLIRERRIGTKPLEKRHLEIIRILAAFDDMSIG